MSENNLSDLERVLAELGSILILIGDLEKRVVALEQAVRHRDECDPV